MTKKEFGLSFEGLGRQLAESTLAAFTAGLSAYLTLIFIVDGINQETFVGIMLQGAVAGAVGALGGMLVYYILGSRELQEIYRSYHSRIFRTDVIAPQQDTL